MRKTKRVTILIATILAALTLVGCMQITEGVVVERFHIAGNTGAGTGITADGTVGVIITSSASRWVVIVQCPETGRTEEWDLHRDVWVNTQVGDVLQRDGRRIERIYR